MSNMRGVFLWCLSIPVIIPSSSASTGPSHVNYPLGPGQELYFEKLGSMDLHTGGWKVILHLRVQDLLEQPKPMAFDDLCATRVYQMLQWCRTSANRDLLKIQQEEVRKGAQQLKKAAEDLEPERSRTHTSGHLILRRDIPPLEFVGEISRHLLGTLTKEDTQALEKHLAMLEENQSNLVKLQNQRAHIVEMSIRSFEEWNTVQKEIFHTQLRQVQQNLDSLNRSQLGFTQDLDLLALEQHTLLELHETRRTQEKLLNILWAAQRGQAHPLLLNQIPWEAVWADLDSLPIPWKLPIISRQRTPEAMGLLVKTQGSYVGARVYFTVEIPLTEGTSYDLYQVHHLGMTSPEQEAKILALSRDRSSYTLLGEREIEECPKHTGGRICPPKWQMRDPQRAIGREKEILEALEPSEEHSPRQGPKHSQNQWIYLHQEDAWLHSLITPEKLLITCFDRDTEVLRVTGQGLLFLARGCPANAPRGTLYTQGRLPPPLSVEKEQDQKNTVNQISTRGLEATQQANEDNAVRMIVYISGAGTGVGAILIITMVIRYYRKKRREGSTLPGETEGGDTRESQDLPRSNTPISRSHPTQTPTLSQGRLNDLPEQVAEV